MARDFWARETQLADYELERRERAQNARENQDEGEASRVLSMRENLADFVKGGWHIMEPDTPLVWNWHLDYICAHLEAVSAGLIRRLIINVPPGHCKPVHTGSMVLLEDGRRVTLSEIIVGDTVITHEGRGRRVVAVHEQGDLPCLQIKTHSGRAVITALDHPFLTPEGWVQAQHLQEGDTLALVTPENRAASPRSIEEFRLAGYFVGDGTCRQYKEGKQLLAQITCLDELQGKDIVHCAETMGFVARAGQGQSSSSKGRYNISNGVRPWLIESGLAGCGSHTKRVPQWVFEGSNEQIRHFVGAYFSCDGTLNQKGHVRTDLCISFTSVNRALLSDVQHLLLRLGINSRVRERVGKGFEGRTVEFAVLELSSQDETARFIAHIPIFGVKAERLQKWGVKRAQFDSVLKPDKIVCIEPVAAAPCRCLTVEGDHSFLIEDIAVHNSLLTSVFWPAWMWLREPGNRVLCASYALSLAIRDASKTKDLVLSEWYQETFGPEWKIRHDSKAKQDYQNSARGSRKSVSVGAGTTGFRGKGVIIDDPLSIMDGYSEKKKHEARTWLFEAAQNRLADPRTGWIVMIMQRVAEDDPTGAALVKLVDKWEHLCLMSEFEPDRAFRTLLADLDPNHPLYERFAKFGTEPRKLAGDLLFPGFFTAHVIEGQKESMGPVAYAGQHQQRPAPAAGHIFKGEHFLEVISMEAGEPHLKLWNPQRLFGDGGIRVREAYMSWDTALKDKTTSDYSAGCLVMLCDDGYVYLLPLEFRRMEVPDVEKRVVMEWVKWKQILGSALKGVRVEEGAGTALIQYIRRMMVSRREYERSPFPNWEQSDWDAVRATPPIVVFPFHTNQNKIEKAYEILPYVAGRNVRLLDSPFSAAWLANLTTFPFASRDDPVDSTVNGVGVFAGIVKGLTVMPADVLESVLAPDANQVDMSVYEESVSVGAGADSVQEALSSALEKAGLGDIFGAVTGH